MSSTDSPNVTLASLQDDVAALRRDLGSLLNHIKTGGAASAQAAAEQIEDGAANLFQGASDEGRKAAGAIIRQVEAQPVLALLVVLGVGFVGGRLLSR